MTDTTIAKKYFALDSPLEAEKEGFACPFEACRFYFDSLDEAHKHHQGWHLGPYQCAICQAKFASQPACDRHFRSSGHGLDLVRPSVESQQTEMDTLDFSAQTPPPELQIPHQDQSIPTEGDHKALTCSVVCCTTFGKDYRYISKYRQHTSTMVHRNAIKIGEKLGLQNLYPEHLLEEHEAVRELRCNALNCFDYGKKFRSPRLFVQHMSTMSHRSGYVFDLGDLSDLPELVVKEEDIAAIQELRCNLHGCPSQGKTYLTNQGLRQHFNTMGHVQASLSRAQNLTPLLENITQLVPPIFPTDLSMNDDTRIAGSSMAGDGHRDRRRCTVQGSRSGQEEAPLPSVEARLEMLEIAQQKQITAYESLKKKFEELVRDMERGGGAPEGTRRDGHVWSMSRSYESVDISRF